MSAVENFQNESSDFYTLECTKPAISVLPLGTGNDLARVLGMGGGYDVKSRSTLVKALVKVNNSVACKLDRWKLNIRTEIF